MIRKKNAQNLILLLIIVTGSLSGSAQTDSTKYNFPRIGLPGIDPTDQNLFLLLGIEQVFITKYPMMPQSKYGSNNYPNQNSENESFKKAPVKYKIPSHKTSPKFVFGTSIYGKTIGWHRGKSSKLILKQNGYDFTPLNLDIWIGQIYYSIGVELGDFESDQININGEIYSGKFTGDYVSYNLINVGYDIIKNQVIAIVPVIGFSRVQYDYDLINYSNIPSSVLSIQYSIGLMFDCNIFSIRIDRKSKIYFKLRAKYNEAFIENHGMYADEKGHLTKIWFGVVLDNY